MNWPFEIKHPVMVSSDDWIRDADGRLVIAAHVADEFNALHAEVERLKKTQRKLARLIDLEWREAQIAEGSGTLKLGQMMVLRSDDDVAAAIKEASDE